MKFLRKMMVSILLLGGTQLVAQNGSTQVSGLNPLDKQSLSARQGDPVTPLDGDGQLGPAFQASECGLDYATATNRLGQRFFPAGVAQPATFTISGIPASAVIVQAFVWCDASGNGVPITLNITNPVFAGFSIPMTLVGVDQDKCWGYANSTTYRADVTATVSGNGNYTISGFPTGSPNDVDGATMVVIWRDPTASFQGDLIIWDGAMVRNGGTVSQTMSGFTACSGNVFNARAFIGVGDLQGLGSQLELNNVGGYPALEDWWDFVEVPTTVFPGQTTSTFGNVSPNDCYNIALYGLYFQSDCNTCTYPCDPKPEFTWNGCNPISFDGYSNGVSPVVSWFWTFGDGGTSTLEDPSHSYAAPGTYLVCLTIITTDSDGKTCCEQFCKKVDVCPPPPCFVQPDFKWYPSNTNPMQIHFVDGTVFGGGSICNYEMDFGDGSPIYSGPTMPSFHIYTDRGVYIVCLKVTVCVYDAAGNVIQKCEERICYEVAVNVNLTPLKKANTTIPEKSTGMNVFPNPANQEINITVTEENAVVRILNANGQEVVAAKAVTKNIYRADLTNLAAGVYFVTVQSADGSVKKEKFVKE